MTRDDWRTLSGLLVKFQSMWLTGDWEREPELRGMLTTWLRDHDMPQEQLEGAGVAMLLDPRPWFEFNCESGLCIGCDLHWIRVTSAAVPSMHSQVVRATLRFRDGYEPHIRAEVT